MLILIVFHMVLMIQDDISSEGAYWQLNGHLQYLQYM